MERITYVRWTIVVVLAVFLVVLLWIAREGMYPFLLAVLLSYFLSPAVVWFERRKVSRTISLILLYVFGGLVVCAFLWKGIPIFLREIESFIESLPQISQQLESVVLSLERYQAEKFPPMVKHIIEQNINEAEMMIETSLGALIHRIIGLMEYTIGVAVSPIIAFYILHDWQRIRKSLFELLPIECRGTCGEIAAEVNHVLSGVIRGQVIISIFVGTAVTVGLYYFGVPYAILLGVLAGILDVIPYFGAIFGAVPAILFGLFISPLTALKVAILFFVVHQLESSIIHPNVVGDSIGMHPLAVLFFVFLGGEVGGLVGMVIGVPLAAIIKIIFHHIMRLTA
ncbi:MAG: AI-2E family transporter [Selenomonadales bacterium]|nr:AI-2E family transporter [Selenomonadales bacterium]MBQ2246783.1 AI-2E family transporter [Selenomonadales bacterium]